MLRVRNRKSKLDLQASSEGFERALCYSEMYFRERPISIIAEDVLTLTTIGTSPGNHSVHLNLLRPVIKTLPKE